MPPVSKITASIAALWSLTFIVFTARPSALTQLLAMATTLGLLVFGFISCVHVFTRRGIDRWRTLLPLATCAVAVVLAPELGGAIRHSLFERQLPRYEAIVATMRAGDIPVSAELRRIPEAEGGSVYAVLAQRSSNGVLTVEFLTGGGFPVKHSGYLYCSSDVVENGSTTDRRWPRRRAVKAFWYRISD